MVKKCAEYFNNIEEYGKISFSGISQLVNIVQKCKLEKWNKKKNENMTKLIISQEKW